MEGNPMLRFAFGHGLASESSLTLAPILHTVAGQQSREPLLVPGPVAPIPVPFSLATTGRDTDR
jgi:hypothetical protein